MMMMKPISKIITIIGQILKTVKRMMKILTVYNRKKMIVKQKQI